MLSAIPFRVKEYGLLKSKFVEIEEYRPAMIQAFDLNLNCKLTNNLPNFLHNS